MNLLQKKYNKLEKYGRIYSRIEKNHYIITFHNVNHQTEKDLRNNIYPILNSLQSECLTNTELIKAAKKHLPLKNAISKTKDMAINY